MARTRDFRAPRCALHPPPVAGFKEGVHKWSAEERAGLQAELDAAYFHLYGLQRDDVQYVLSTFQGRRDDQESAGLWDRNDLVLEHYDRLSSRG